MLSIHKKTMKKPLCFIFTNLAFLGLQQLQTWTKESLKEKPFSTTKGKIWTETPNSIPLEKIFTRLRVVKKHKETFGVRTEELSGITQLLGEPEYGQSIPVRIIAKGKNLVRDVFIQVQTVFSADLRKPCSVGAHT